MKRINEYQEALDTLKNIQVYKYATKEFYDYQVSYENSEEVEILQELVDKTENLIEYLIELKRTHTMSRFLNVSDLESFRYAVDLVLNYLSEKHE